VVIISLTLGYYLLTFVLDMSLLLCPQRSQGLFAICQKREGPKGRAGAKNAAGGVGLGGPGSGDDASGGSGAGEMHVNPFMLKQMSANKGGDEDNTFGDVAGILDPTAVAAMSGVPSDGMWKAIQASYGRLAVMVDSLRAELRDSKKAADAVSAAENGRAGGHGRANPLAAKTRRQFGPVMRRDEDEEEGGAAKLKPRSKVSGDDGDEADRGRSRSGSGGVSSRTGMRAGSARRLIGGGGGGDGAADTGMLTNPIAGGGDDGDDDASAAKRAGAMKTALSGFGARNPLGGRKPGGLVLGSRRAVAKEFTGGDEDV